MKSTDTIHDLKLRFEEEEGIPPEHQSYFSGPVELEDETLVSTLVEVFGDTLDVKLRKAAMMSTNHDITIVYGKGRKKFEKVHLKAGLSREIKLKHNKFGIVTHVFENKDDNESGGKDNNVYTVERYKLPTDKEQTIVLKSERNNTVAYFSDRPWRGAAPPRGDGVQDGDVADRASEERLEDGGQRGSDHQRRQHRHKFG